MEMLSNQSGKLSVDDYFITLSPEQRSELERVREIVQATVPDSELVMSYGTPTVRYKGKNLIHFAAFKTHMSIFPGAEAVELLKDQLAGYKVSKGTIQYSLERPLPDKIIVEATNISVKAINAHA